MLRRPDFKDWLVIVLVVLIVLVVTITAGRIEGFLRALISPAAAQSMGLQGVASVIDGDTLDLQGQRIRLHGIDAPERGQNCKDADGTSWPCGQRAALALADRIGRKPVTCVRTDSDTYGRIIAICYRNDVDLNAWLVANGHAQAYRKYSRDYVAEEEQAQRAQLGIWAGRFTAPWTGAGVTGWILLLPQSRIPRRTGAGSRATSIATACEFIICPDNSITAGHGLPPARANAGFARRPRRRQPDGGGQGDDQPSSNRYLDGVDRHDPAECIFADV